MTHFNSRHPVISMLHKKLNYTGCVQAELELSLSFQVFNRLLLSLIVFAIMRKFDLIHTVLSERSLS